ncbi:MAG: PspC domain-containing protein [Bacteroidetes bacterium]|nr:PspC domain-containing protein [Bacteroidota bacterium]
MEKRLYKIPHNKMIGGVCTGLGAYFSIDPVLIRLVFVILAFQQGVGILAYIILWIVVPVHPEAVGAVTDSPGDAPTDTVSSANADQDSHGGRGSLIGGAVLIVIGALFLLDNFLPGFDFSDFWPLFLIAIGTGMLWNSWPRRSSLDEEVAS